MFYSTTSSRNLIKDAINLMYLKMCARLCSLTLEGNPIVSAEGGYKVCPNVYNMNFLEL